MGGQRGRTRLRTPPPPPADNSPPHASSVRRRTQAPGGRRGRARCKRRCARIGTAGALAPAPAPTDDDGWRASGRGGRRVPNRRHAEISAWEAGDAVSGDARHVPSSPAILCHSAIFCHSTISTSQIVLRHGLSLARRFTGGAERGAARVGPRRTRLAVFISHAHADFA